MAQEQVLFRQPNAPEEFGVALAPAQLRRLDFSALDFEMMRRAGIEYIRTYFPNDFNDFFASNGVIMMLELVSYVGNILSQRSDILIDEAFLSTAQTKDAVIQHLELINQEIIRATPAVVDVEVSIETPLPTEVKIPAATSFSLTGPDQQPVTYEIYRAPGDFVSPVSIPPGKRGVIAHGIEGYTVEPITAIATGGVGQKVVLDVPNVLDEPITVMVTTGEFARYWSRIEIIEKAGPNDEVFEVRHLENRTEIILGDDQAGKAPLAGEEITVAYRIGGGVRGRIAANTINETRPINPEPPVTAAVEVRFRNLVPSSGGTDEETIEQAKRRAPREFATQGNAVTSEDYALLAQEYSHPVFGTVAKAVGTLRTGVDQDFEEIARKARQAATVEEAAEAIQNDFVNRNIVELYVLAEGPESTPVAPSSGLRRGLITFFEEINVLTDEVRVFDGAVKAVDVTATVVMSRNADVGTVKVAVEDAIRNFFDLRNFDMGTGLYVSNLYAILEEIPGVRYVDIFKPQDDVIQTNKIAEEGSDGIGINEVITLGELDLKFYLERGNFKVPPVGK
jgi:hypothetical protein